MLKLNYSEAGLYIEQMKTAPDLWIAQRVLLAARAGQAIYVEPSHASFLVPAHLPELALLKLPTRPGRKVKISLVPVDDEFVEVNLWGTWIAASQESHEGLFIVVLSDRKEAWLYTLWQKSAAQMAIMKML